MQNKETCGGGELIKENKRHDLGFNLSKHILSNTLNQITCLYKHS